MTSKFSIVERNKWSPFFWRDGRVGLVFSVLGVLINIREYFDAPMMILKSFKAI